MIRLSLSSVTHFKIYHLYLLFEFFSSGSYANIPYANIANVAGRFCQTVPRNQMIHCFEFNHGCNGGYIEKTLDRILQLGGLYNNCERLTFVPNAFLQVFLVFYTLLLKMFRQEA
jgi:hypothetical protein